jgi:hypothetical protein
MNLLLYKMNIKRLVTSLIIILTGFMCQAQSNQLSPVEDFKPSKLNQPGQ